MTWMDEYFAAWNRGDGESVTSYMVDDIVYTDVALGKRFENKADVATFVVAANRSGVTFVPQRAIDGVDHYYVEWVMEPHGIPGVSVGALREGKIVTNNDYWNDPRPARTGS